MRRRPKAKGPLPMGAVRGYADGGRVELDPVSAAHRRFASEAVTRQQKSTYRKPEDRFVGDRVVDPSHADRDAARDGYYEKMKQVEPKRHGDRMPMAGNRDDNDVDVLHQRGVRM